MNGVIFYFSGTGNSKFIARMFAQKMGFDCVDIEEAKQAAAWVSKADTVAFCYPIYGSTPPRPMREFVAAHKSLFDGKQLIIFCTQLLGSGDGARCLTDHMKGVGCRVIYAEHFLMPNNVNNLFFLPITGDKRDKKYCADAKKKKDRVCEDIQKGRVVLRGFNPLSKLLGLSQRAFMPGIEARSTHKVYINENCTRCGLCTQTCPVGNLILTQDRMAPQGNCMLCYRCTNLCPQRAIKVLFRAWPKKQYRFWQTDGRL